MTAVDDMMIEGAEGEAGSDRFMVVDSRTGMWTRRVSGTWTGNKTIGDNR